MADTLTYVLTTVSEDGADDREEVDTFTFDRGPLPVGRMWDEGTDQVITFALWHAQRLGQEVQMRMHDRAWSPSYTAYPDGSLYYHATGRKRGFVRGPRS